MHYLNDHDLTILKMFLNSESSIVEKFFQDDSGQWMMYTGDKIYWFYGKYGNDQRMVISYNATSGFKGYQKAKFSNMKDVGPVPEGKYWVLLAPDPNRIANASKTTGELLSNPKGGIEQIPKSTITSDGREWIYTAWGTIRARLFPDNSTKTYGRTNFYLHDSTKGYSHGCIEVEHTLFDRLIRARKKFTKIALMVEYSSPETITKGNTIRL